MTVVTEPTLSDLHAVVDEVWESFLGGAEQLTPVEATPAPIPGWSAAITVSGGWKALVLVQLTQGAARSVTVQMLGMGEDEEPSSADLTDALGELVNVIGGNVKSLMPGPSQLSLPLVAQGIVSSSSASDLVEACRLDLTWAGQPVRVAVSVSVDPTETRENQ